MKHLKIIGIAAVAAMAMMAVVGAGTASATTKLCAKVDGQQANGCPAGKKEPGNNVHIEAKSTNATLTSSITNVICEESATTLHADTSTPVGQATTITGAVTALSFGKCKTSGGTACTVQVIGLEAGGTYPGHIEGTVDGLTDTSRLQVTGGKAKVVCGFLINCTFSTASAVLDGVNGSPTTFTANKVKLSSEGGFCPATSEWDAVYSVVTPEGLTIH